MLVVLAVVVALGAAAIPVAGLVNRIRARGPSLTEEEKFDRAVEAALADRTRALLAKDEKAYLAFVDPAAKPVLAQERRLFRNLVAIPYDSARFETFGFGEASTGVPGGRLYQVRFVHRVHGVDRGDAALGYDQDWRRQGDRVLLVRSKPGRHGASGNATQPVDVAEFRAQNLAHVTVLAPPAVRSAKLIGAAAEQAAVRVLGFWRGRPGPARFLIFLAPTDAAARSWYGGTGGEAAAFTVGLSSTATETPAYVGSRVVVDVPTATGRNSEIERVLQHEFTHAITLYVRKPSRSPVADSYPIWAEEGFACYVEELDRPVSRLTRLPSLRYLIRQGTWDRTLPPADHVLFYAGDALHVTVNYGAAQLVYRYVAQRYGGAKAVDLYVRLASQRDGGLAGTLRALVGQDPRTFQRAWLAWVTTVAG